MPVDHSRGRRRRSPSNATPVAPRRSVCAPVAPVASTRAPPWRQRATTPGSGWPKRLCAPAETSARRRPVARAPAGRASTAATNAGSDEPRLPWCATSTASARSSAGALRTRPRSTTSPMSPGSNSVAPLRARTRSTQLDSLSRYGNHRGGWRKRNSTPSHRHVMPARQAAARGTRTLAGSARRSAGMPSGDQDMRGGNARATER